MRGLLLLLLACLVSGTARGQDGVVPDLPHPVVLRFVVPDLPPPVDFTLDGKDVLASLDEAVPVLDDDPSGIIEDNPQSDLERQLQDIIAQLPREKRAELIAMTRSGDLTKVDEFFRYNGVPVRRAVPAVRLSGYWQTRCVNGDCTQTWVDTSGRQAVSRSRYTTTKKAPTTTRRRLIWRRR